MLDKWHIPFGNRKDRMRFSFWTSCSFRCILWWDLETVQMSLEDNSQREYKHSPTSKQWRKRVKRKLTWSQHLSDMVSASAANQPSILHRYHCNTLWPRPFNLYLQLLSEKLFSFFLFNWFGKRWSMFWKNRSK